MKNALAILLFAAGLAASAPAASVALDPVGIVRITCPGASDTIVSLPLQRPAVFTGTASAATVTADAVATLTFNGTPFAADAFKYVAGSQPTTYCAFLASGPREGASYTILGNTAGTLTIDLNGDDFSAVTEPVVVRIVPYWTLGTVFPSGAGVEASSGFTAATQVLIPDHVGVGVNLAAEGIYYYSASAGTWMRSGSSGSADDTVLYPESSFTIRNNGSSATNFAFAGAVVVNKQIVPLASETGTRQDNAVALPRPVPVTLAESGLVSSGAFSASSGFAPGDQLFVYDNTVAQLHKAASRIYTYVNGAWRRSGGSEDAGTDGVFLPGTGVLIRKAKSVSGVTVEWVVPAPAIN